MAPGRNKQVFISLPIDMPTNAIESLLLHSPTVTERVQLADR